MQLKTIATPLTIGSFILVSVTGVCMFFEIHAGFIQPAHEFLSLAFLAGALMHIVVHRKAILNHLKKPLGIGLALLFGVITICAVLPLNTGAGGAGHEVARKSEAIFLDANVNSIAKMTHRSSDELLALLASQGYAQEDSLQTVREIAIAAKHNPHELLALLLKSVPLPAED